MPELAGDTQAEDPNVFAVAAIEPPGFLDQPENPFESTALHPERGAFDLAGQEINRRANSDGYWNAESAVIHGDPFFLLGTAERNKKKVGLGLQHAFANLFVV